jgi:hypothetical protein
MLRFFDFQVNLSTDQGRIKEIEVTARMTAKPEVIRLKRKLVLRFYERLAGDSRRDQGLRSLRRSADSTEPQFVRSPILKPPRELSATRRRLLTSTTSNQPKCFPMSEKR